LRFRLDQSRPATFSPHTQQNNREEGIPLPFKGLPAVIGRPFVQPDRIEAERFDQAPLKIFL
jgi:hypothetical protein